MNRMKTCVIGVDFGTLSARAVVCDTENGRVLGEAECAYAHGVMDAALPDGTQLPPDWALQHPADYLSALESAVRGAMEKSGAEREAVVGIGVDFTASTVLPVRRDGTPLCMLEAYAHEPHAYVKLWKHHGAQAEADRMNEAAHARGEAWLNDFGGRISCEMALPKLYQVLREAPEIYAAMDDWMEAGDWVIWQLTGERQRSHCAAGYKSFYRKGEGYPPKAYFAALDARLEHAAEEKLSAPVIPAVSRAGALTQEMAVRLGLCPGIAVAAAMVDAHAGVIGAGLSRSGQMLGIIGTSACYMTLGDTKRHVPGIFGVVEDGILPGCFGYEAGQSCVGDLFGWLAEGFAPESYKAEAEKKGVSVHQLMTELAQRQHPGEHGLLALDWWNGCRSPLMDGGLSGLLLGMTLRTKPEEIYRALIESTAYGARMIAEGYRAGGVPVDAFYMTGGIAKKNAMAMQIYADVLGMDVQVIASRQCGALGAAILASAAAGRDIREAIAAMASTVERVYTPDAEAAAVYDQLYAEYEKLLAFFGRGGSDVMKRLRAISARA